MICVFQYVGKGMDGILGWVKNESITVNPPETFGGFTDLSYLLNGQFFRAEEPVTSSVHEIKSDPYHIVFMEINVEVVA